MRNLLLTWLLAAACLNTQAQDRVWVFFSDKGTDVAEKLQQPEQFLSPEALERRYSLGIGVDESDLPVATAYAQAVRANSQQLLLTSRWMNAAAVEASAEQISRIEALPFVTSTRPVGKLKLTRTGKTYGPLARGMNQHAVGPFDYGDATMQNEMLNVPAMHERGLTGKGVRMALFDSGFDAVDTLDAFDSLWINKQIIGYYDFVDGDTTVFREDSHGTQVLSTIAANLPGEIVGTAPHASFILCRTEDAGSETQQEEHNWVKAMEWVDSLGVDIIHTSLGYSEFDDEEENYTYESMDGNTAIISRAADVAASKGIIVTTSAGNEGRGSWKYITAPCDADSVICVGAINKFGKRSSFSSFGPASDGRVKPDVVALGSRTTVVSPRNYTTSSDGTSFSGPLVAGMVACVRQAHPKRTNMDIVQAIRLSGDQYNTPDGEYGYGIPDAMFADSLLANVDDLSTVKIEDEVKPERGKPKEKPVEKPIVFTDNPQSKVIVSGGTLTVMTTSTIQEVQIMYGKQKVLLPPKSMNVSDNNAVFKTNFLQEGEHYVKIKTGSYTENVKFTP
ncbi:MAG: S8 family serine peptidase [Bacteroidota bacterium]